MTYDSRDFESGKKVRLFRDPLTWVVACAKFRVAPGRAAAATSRRRPVGGGPPVTDRRPVAVITGGTHGIGRHAAETARVGRVVGRRLLA